MVEGATVEEEAEEVEEVEGGAEGDETAGYDQADLRRSG